MKAILKTENDPSVAITRVVLGVVIFAHGAQKALGWFGGAGLNGTIDSLNQYYGIPGFLTVLVTAAEFLGGLGLITGTLTRVAAAGVIPVMIGAILIVHVSNGFFMNWFGNQPGEGFEFHLLVIAMSALLVFKGGGALSLDRVLYNRDREETA